MMRYILYSLLIHIFVIAAIHWGQLVLIQVGLLDIDVQARAQPETQIQIQMQSVQIEPKRNDLEAVPTHVLPINQDNPANQKQSNQRNVLIRSKIAQKLLEIPYPALARKMGMQGTVIIRIYIDTEGRLSRHELVQSSGYDLLDRTALKGIAGWQFGTGAATSLLVPVVFRLL